MNEFKQYVKDSKLLEIAKKVWTVFPEMEFGKDQAKEIELTEFGINKLKIQKIKEDAVAYFSPDEYKVYASNASNLAHELSHVVYNYSKNQRKYFGGMQSYIIDKKKILVEYLKSDNIKIYDKFIGYLCLADNDELTAKLAGFYVPHLFKEKETDYYKKLKPIYNDMKEFTCSPNEIAEIIRLDKENKLISPHLSANGFKNPLDSNAIQTLIK